MRSRGVASSLEEWIVMDHGQGRELYWQEGARHAHDGWWSGPLHAVVLLLLVALLVVGVVWIVRRLSTGTATATAVPAAVPVAAAAVAADPAVAALRMRYARGEVSREDFRHGMDDLTGAAAPWPGSDPGENAAPTES